MEYKAYFCGQQLFWYVYGISPIFQRVCQIFDSRVCRFYYFLGAVAYNYYVVKLHIISSFLLVGLGLGVGLGLKCLGGGPPQQVWLQDRVGLPGWRGT